MWVRWQLKPLQPLQQTQIQPPVSPSVDLLCHPWFTTTNFSYRFPILKLPPPPCAVLLVSNYDCRLLETMHVSPFQRFQDMSSPTFNRTKYGGTHTFHRPSPSVPEMVGNRSPSPPRAPQASKCSVTMTWDLEERAFMFVEPTTSAMIWLWAWHGGFLKWGYPLNHPF